MLFYQVGLMNLCATLFKLGIGFQTGNLGLLCLHGLLCLATLLHQGHLQFRLILLNREFQFCNAFFKFGHRHIFLRLLLRLYALQAVFKENNLIILLALYTPYFGNLLANLQILLRQLLLEFLRSLGGSQLLLGFVAGVQFVHSAFHLGIEFRIFHLADNRGIIGLVYCKQITTFGTLEFFHIST